MPRLLHSFNAELDRINRTRQRVEALHAPNNLRRSDVERVYEALFLRAITSFEHYLETLFLAVITQQIAYPRSRVRLRVTFVTDQAARDILLGGRKYVTWLPLPETIQRAERFLYSGRPFTEIGEGQKDMIRNMVTVRNAIAHKSTAAKSRFAELVTRSGPLLRTEKSPAGFLASQPNPAIADRRFDHYTKRMLDVAALLYPADQRRSEL